MISAKLKVFLRGDVKNIVRDPFMMLVLFVPVLMVLLLQFGIPAIDEHLMSGFNFQFQDHDSFVVAIFLFMTPIMVGMVTGFLLLDEKDDGIFSYMDITPVRKTGYLIYRISIPAILAWGINILIVIYFFPENKLLSFLLLIALIVSSAIAPIMTLYLAAFAKNKVEGMAYSKAVNIFLLAPAATYIFDHPITMLTYVVPITWSAEALYFIHSSESYGYIQSLPMLVLGGAIVHFIFLYVLYKRIEKII
ncbi:hypothetical protein [Evansella halocellulosilytica]|uniref:hypothetical protein n=1 Tax=Evansella halocellulosilytica TaxID=2011013 RepID=UPI000BB8AEDB|nr:hypothetical protein [Evansella halocellulosilytica]